MPMIIPTMRLELVVKGIKVSYRSLPSVLAVPRHQRAFPIGIITTHLSWIKTSDPWTPTNGLIIGDSFPRT
jgi:hypothetical protein